MWTEIIEHADQVGVGIASVVSAVAAVLWPILRRLRRLQKKVDSLTDTSAVGILRATKGNILALCRDADPKKIRTLDIRFEGDIYVSIPVIMGMSYSPFPGLDLMGLREWDGCTHYSIQTTSNVTLVRHSHEETETVQVIAGTMTDLDSGRVYRSGETWEIAPNEDHRVHFEPHGLFMVQIRPPLPGVDVRPVNVDRLEDLADLT